MSNQINKYKLIIPVSPDSINQVVTFGKKDGDVVALKHKWQKIAHTFIADALNEEMLPTKFRGRVAFFFKLYFATTRARDGDNYEMMCKGIIDAFVQKRMIEDDSCFFVDDDGRRLIVDSERPRVVIYIKEKIPEADLVEIDYSIPPKKPKVNWLCRK